MKLRNNQHRPLTWDQTGTAVPNTHPSKVQRGVQVRQCRLVYCKILQHFASATVSRQGHTVVLYQIQTRAQTTVKGTAATSRVLPLLVS
jgi:hypothetical protein